MGMSTIFKYLGLAMEAATQAASVNAQIKEVKAPDSPGGKEITQEELKMLVENLDDSFSTVVTRICEEAGLKVKSVNVQVEML
jgi:hypothetical protein